MHHKVNMTEREGNRNKDAQEIGNKITTWLLFMRVMRDCKRKRTTMEAFRCFLRVDVHGRKIRKTSLCQESALLLFLSFDVDEWLRLVYSLSIHQKNLHALCNK